MCLKTCPLAENDLFSTYGYSIKAKILRKNDLFSFVCIFYISKILRKNVLFSFVCIFYKHDPGFGREQQESALMRFLDNFPW